MVLLRLQLGWIYFDAGYGKVMGEWSWSTELPALAVYLQGAPFGRDLIHWDRQLLDGFLVRLLTVLAAWVEVFVGPVMLVALNAPRWVGFLPIIMVILLHIGIAFCMEGGMAIGFVAIATWLALLPQPHQPHASVKGSKRCQGRDHTVLLRSDGQAVACGCNIYRQCLIPDLANGMTYAQVSAGGNHTVLLRSDGQAVVCRLSQAGRCRIPPLDPSHHYVCSTQVHILQLIAHEDDADEAVILIGLALDGHEVVRLNVLKSDPAADICKRLEHEWHTLQTQVLSHGKMLKMVLPDGNLNPNLSMDNESHELFFRVVSASDAMLGDVANGHARLGFGDTVALCWCLASFGFALSGLPSQPGPIPTVLLLNRWQVFSGAERTMNWEVAPARLANGDIVNLWTWQNVSFAKPSRYGRRGRWMSFPSTRPASPKALEARFRYLCTEWNVAHSVPVLKYQLFELWASLGPNLETLPPFKTLVHVQDCDPEKDGVVALPAAGNIPLSTAQAIRVAFHEGCHERI
eukprot:symbB.v1.2.040291.t2/scaffold7126.1/size13177/1